MYKRQVYNVLTLPAKIRPFLEAHGVKVKPETRIHHAEAEQQRIKRLYDHQGGAYEADAFIDATGTAGPPASCIKYGNGCAMCVLRCPSFGGRRSICTDLDIKEYANISGKRTGALSGSCELVRESLDPRLLEILNNEGKAVVPIPEDLKHDLLASKACRQYALEEYRDNAVLLDNGHVKLMSPYFPLNALRKIPGFEKAVYADPLAGGKGNSVRFTAMAPRDDHMRSETVENLFFAGEKAGPLVGHTEAIATGTLAGCNAVRLLMDKPLLKLPSELASGDGIAYSNARRKQDPSARLTFSGGELFERMKSKGTYLTDRNEILRRVKAMGLENIFC